MIEIGRVYVKIAGKEAGLKAVIVEKINDNFVLIDGEVKRRRCNVNHLMPLEFKLEIKGKAKTEDVKAALKKAGLWKTEIKKIRKKDKKEKKTERPRKKHAVKKILDEVPKKKAKKKPKKKAVKKILDEVPKKKPKKKAVKKKAAKKVPKKKAVKKKAAKKPAKKKAKKK